MSPMDALKAERDELLEALDNLYEVIAQAWPSLIYTEPMAQARQAILNAEATPKERAG